MTDHIQIGDVAPRIRFTANGVNTEYAFGFPIFKAADLEVWVDGAKAESGFTIAGAGDSGGGTVTFDTAPADGASVVLLRRLAIQRTTDFQEAGTFRAKAINDELDYQIAALQQVADDVTRALRLDPTDTSDSLALPAKTDRAGRFLAFDGAGAPIASAGPGSVPVSAAMEPLVQAGDAAAARGALGLVVGTDVLAPDGDGSGLTGIVTGATATERANILLNAFRIQVVGGLSVLDMIDGVVDEFEDETGIDAGASEAQDYDGTNDCYAPDLSATTVSNGATGWSYYGALMTFTGANIVTASNSGLTATRTTADLTGDFEFSFTVPSSNNVANAADQYQFGVTESLPTTTNSSLEMVGNNAIGSWWMGMFGAGSGRTLTFHHNNSSEGTVADVSVAAGDVFTFRRVGSTLRVERNETTIYTFSGFSSTAAFRGICGLGGTGGACVLQWDGLTWTVNQDVTGMTLVSEPVTAEAEPDGALIVVWQEDVDSVTLNTDLRAYASRDGGTSWTAVTLAQEGSLSAGRILVGTADISGQPSGTSMAWKLVTANSKHLKIHAVGLEWR